MRRSRISLFLAFIGSMLVLSTRVSAQTAAPTVPDTDFTVRGNMGLLHQSDGAVFMLEPMGAFRYKFLTAGAGVRIGFYHHLSTSLGPFAQGGFVLPLERGRFEVVGLAGLNRHNGVGRDVGFRDDKDPGLDVTLPFAGMRVGGGALLGSRRTRVYLGGSIAFERDLRRGARSYQYHYVEDSWLDNEPEENRVGSGRQRYGWTRLGVFVHIGVVLMPKGHAAARPAPGEGRPARRVR